MGFGGEKMIVGLSAMESAGRVAGRRNHIHGVSRKNGKNWQKMKGLGGGREKKKTYIICREGGHLRG